MTRDEWLRPYLNSERLIGGGPTIMSDAEVRVTEANGGVTLEHAPTGVFVWAKMSDEAKTRAKRQEVKKGIVERMRGVLDMKLRLFVSEQAKAFSG